MKQVAELMQESGDILMVHRTRSREIADQGTDWDLAALDASEDRELGGVVYLPSRGLKSLRNRAFHV